MNCEPKLLELLKQRGIETEADIREFLSDKPQKTYDPFLLLNMEAGVDLILSSIDAGEKICIYGDYDADGITSVSILMEVLSHITDNLEYYIPSRFEEGYGLNIPAIDKIKKGGASLIVTVDCGCVSVEEVKHANEIGMKILVTDHHRVGDKKIDCLLIDPTQEGCPYPFKYLAGCGVAFKLAQAVVTKKKMDKTILTGVLDFVGIGTIGDIVPLVDENRTLAKYGLRALNTGKRKSLNQLVSAIGLKTGHITAEQVSFGVVPHLNAAGRIENARIAAQLLQSEDDSVIHDGVAHLIELNNTRKKLQGETFDRAEACVAEKFSKDDFLLIDLDDGHEGITGIVAGKIKDDFYRPTVIVTPIDDEYYKGTGRSIEGVNLHEILKENEEMFRRFGGHAAACGFTMKKEYLSRLRENANKKMREILSVHPEIGEKTANPDMFLQGDDVTLDLVNQFTLLEPCGCANERPLIAVQGNTGAISTMGNMNQYGRFSLEMDNGRRLACVMFRDVDRLTKILQKDGISVIIGSLRINVWNGRTSLQMSVENAYKAGE